MLWGSEEPCWNPHANPRTMPRKPPAKIPARKTSVDALKPSGVAYDAYFEAPKGFHVRVYPSGVKVFALRFRDAIGGKSAARGASGKAKYRRLTLGTYGDITITEAAALATSARGRLSKGERPQDDKKKRAAVPTVSELVTTYLAELRKDCDPQHVREVDRLLTVHLIPNFGTEPITLVTPADMQALHTDLHETPSEANHAIVAMSAFFAFAIRQLHITVNPAAAQFVKRYPKPRRRVVPLTDAQVSALGDAMRAAEANGVPWQVPAALRLLFLTGCRKSEILNLRWVEVDRERQRLTFLDSKGMKLSDRAEDQRHISAEALAVLETIRAEKHSDVYVLPHFDDPTVPVRHIDRQWREIRDAAKLTGFTLHGFRHDMASDIGARYPAAAVKSLLGHTNIATSSLYVHTVDDPMKAAADTVGADRAKRLARPAETLKLVG